MRINQIIEPSEDVARDDEMLTSDIEIEDVSMLDEKALSRIWEKMENYNTGMITAYRSEYSLKENQQRNKSLLAKLMDHGFSVTSVKGSYIENYGTDKAKEVGEHSFFVSDEGTQDEGYDETLKNVLAHLGKEFGQDSILFTPKGGKYGLLIGTNAKNPDAYPGYGKELKLGNPKFGKSGEFMTKVSGRPFLFEGKIIREHEGPKTLNGKRGLKILSRMRWEEI